MTENYSPQHLNEMRWYNGKLQLSPKYFTRFLPFDHYAWAREINDSQGVKEVQSLYQLDRLTSDQEVSQSEFATRITYSEGWHVFSYLMRNPFNGSWSLVKSVPTSVEAIS